MIGELIKSLFMPFSLSSTKILFVCNETVKVDKEIIPLNIQESIIVSIYLTTLGSFAFNSESLSNSSTLPRIFESSKSLKKKT